MFCGDVAHRIVSNQQHSRTLAPLRVLLQLQDTHQRFNRYIPCIDFFSGVDNLISDRPSLSLDLTNNQLLAYLNTNFPQPLPWQLWTPLLKLVSGIASAL